MSAALLGLAACQNEISPVEKPSEDNTQIKDYPYELCFTALNESSVKTTLNDTQILWEDNDEIKVFWGVGKSNKAVGSLNEDKTSATFNTKVEEAETYYAIYPYTEAECMTEDGKIVVEIPAIQNGAFRNANIMLAKAEDYTLNFKHLVGLMEFTTDLTGTIEIAGAEGDILTGTVTVTGFEENGAPVYEVADGSNTIKLEVTEPGTYYAAFLPSAELECLTIKMTNGEGDAKTTEYALSANGIEMGRGRLVPLGDITGQFGKNLFVKADADGNGDGKTWETALSYAQVAAMLTLAEADGKIFNFAAGEYKNDEQIYINKATGDELLKISFKGGYVASSTGTDLTKNDPSANVTKITGADGKRAFRIGRRIDMTFKGVTFSGGNGDGDVDGNDTPDGGGILIADNDSDSSILTFDNCAFSGNTSSSGGAFVTKAAKVVLKGCTLSGNTATDRGGAIFVNHVGTLDIDGGEFTKNTAKNGGAVYTTDNTSLYILNTNMSENTSTNFGGAVFIYDGTPTDITGANFSKNSASQKGGAIYSEKNDNNTSKKPITISGVTFDTNTAGASGGGLFINSHCAVTIKDNSVFNGNSAKDYGGAILNNGRASATYNISNTIFSKNQCTSSRGGAIYASAGTYTISDCQFIDNKIATNTGDLGGGAICACNSATQTITRCTFIGNICVDEKGGAIYNSSCTQTISGCTFKNNISEKGTSSNNWTNIGGAIYGTKCKITATDTDFIDNTSYGTGGACNIQGASTATFTGCNFEGNTTTAGGGGAFYGIGKSNYTFNNCDFTENESSTGRGGAIWVEKDTPTYKINMCNFDGNISKNWGTAISVSQNSGQTVYINNTTFKNNKSTNAYNVLDRGTVAAAGNTYINNCLFHDNYEAANKHHSSVIFDAEGSSTSSSKAVGLLINCTIIEAKHDKAVSVDGTSADATIVNNVLLSNSDAALRLGVDGAGNLKSGGYNFFNSYSKKDDTCKYTIAEGATEVADATYAEGSALFTDQYMWKAAPAQTMTTAAELSTWVKANVTGGDAFITWLDTVDGLTKDLAGNPRGSGSIYPGCYQN